VPLVGDDLALLGRPTSLLRPLVDAALAAGRRADAELWTDHVDRYLETVGRPPAARVRVACARAALLIEAEPARAAEIAGEAVALGVAESVRTDTLRARLLLGRALAAADERDTAVAELEQALADARSAAAIRLASEAARELRRLGARPAAVRGAAQTPEELSARERSIARLVAEGRSNKEVAAALFVSPKTVENNLSRIYAKLGVRSRTELAAALRGDAARDR
jgi:DNA-binding CsgD family transcriptional regulator